MRSIAAMLMAFSIALSPLGAGLTVACTPQACLCSVMADQPHDLEAMAGPQDCTCPPATDAPCCVARQRFPDRSSDWRPIERTDQPDPTPAGLESTVGGVDTVDGQGGRTCSLRRDRRAPPVRAHVLHQRFLI